ncbi:hypothetical protein OE059_03265 [Exiguobacterium profundum]|uniref:Uncharacterized protein n=1 Tax=Exiguobacterium profundum TaxID=307643 RepID=A0ABY8B3Y1_9BACL|nr:hypothetical protein [Exiguobacterium profundum]WED55891.1 hypothetical protein OE059_03265 [Exiguobacterium profundum]
MNKKLDPYWKLFIVCMIMIILIIAVPGIYNIYQNESEYQSGSGSIEDTFQSAYDQGYSEENAIEVLEHVIYNQERGDQIGYDVYELKKRSEYTFYVRTELMEIELEIKDGDGHTSYRLTEWHSGRELVVSVDY